LTNDNAGNTEISRFIAEGVWTSHNCPCCFYVEDIEGEIDYSICKELCPGMSLWGVEDAGTQGVPCELNTGSLYKIVKNAKNEGYHNVATNTMKKIVIKFRELYEAEGGI